MLAHTNTIIPVAMNSIKNVTMPGAADDKIDPIRIALTGFSGLPEADHIISLFSRANRWQQPWEMVESIHDAQILLVAVDTVEELLAHKYGNRYSRDQLIAYSTQPLEDARWHLRRSPDSRPPTPLEFTLLLKEIGQEIAAKRLTIGHTPMAAVTPKRDFDWRQRLKILIVGSVGSGKTTAVSTLSQGHSISTEATPSDHTQLHKKATTVAMDFGCVALNEDTQLHIYGAPGQRRFDFMNEILIRNAMGLIILVSNKTSNPLNELGYYLDANADYLARHQAVIGVTHNDLNATPSLNEYRRFIQARGESWPVVKVDARKPDDMLRLVETLLDVTLEHG